MSQKIETRVFAAVEATWPPAKLEKFGGIVVRDGQGGGKRVSAATIEGTITSGDIEKAETWMTENGQSPLFMVRSGEDEIDNALAKRGYRIVDPVLAMQVNISHLTDVPIPPVTTFCIWEPLAIMEEIWAKGGIGSGRLDVMKRASVKTGILARWSQKPAGTGYVSVDGNFAMVHAVEVLPDQRRKGVAGWIMRQAAFWAREQGAEFMVVLCTKANKGALALYSGLGFEPVTEYHYRQKMHPGDLEDG